MQRYYLARPGEKDPVRQYGTDAAAWIIRNLSSVPAGERGRALRALLSAVDPTLYPRVLSLKAELEGRAMSPTVALEQALAACMSAGMLAELAAIGKGSSVEAESHLGVGMDPEQAKERALCELGWNPFGAVAKLVTGGVQHYTGRAASAGAKFANKGVEYLGKIACKVSRMPGAEAAATAYNPAAGAGVAVVGTMCAPDQVPYVPPPPAQPGWLWPVLIAGGVAVVVLAVRR